MNKNYPILLLKFKRFFTAFLIMLALLTTIVPLTFGQETPSYSKNYAITWEPTTLFAGGWRFGFDMRVQDRNWIQIIPTVYLYQGIHSYMDWWHDDEYYYDQECHVTSSHGFGIGANYKRFFTKHEFVYCHGGIDYSFRRADVHFCDFIPYEDDDFPGYIYDKIYEKQDFNRISLTACLGIQTPMRHGFYIDNYMGIGYKYAFYNENKPALDRGFNDYGYRGFYLAIGFRMGVAF